jgi:acetyl-CoA acetyltransferase
VAADAPDGRRAPQPRVRLRGSALRTERFHGPGADNPDAVELAAREAYEQAGLGPEDIDLAQVHDAATIGEILRIEALGLVPRGEGWVATREGRTEIGGALPVNTDGGLLAMGHPFGASGIRMLHETVTQLRGTAGARQVSRARAGLVQCSGAGGVCSVIIASR